MKDCYLCISERGLPPSQRLDSSLPIYDCHVLSRILWLLVPCHPYLHFASIEDFPVLILILPLLGFAPP